MAISSPPQVADFTLPSFLALPNTDQARRPTFGRKPITTWSQAISWISRRNSAAETSKPSALRGRRRGIAYGDGLGAFSVWLEAGGAYGKQRQKENHHEPSDEKPGFFFDCLDSPPHLFERA